MKWCLQDCAHCSFGSDRYPVSGCPYGEDCEVWIHDFLHVMGDHRRCGLDCDIARGLYPGVVKAGKASATAEEVAIVSCLEGAIEVHGTYRPNEARHARTAVGKMLGIPPEDGPEGRSWLAIKGSVLIVCQEGHVS